MSAYNIIIVEFDTLYNNPEFYSPNNEGLKKITDKNKFGAIELSDIIDDHSRKITDIKTIYNKLNRPIHETKLLIFPKSFKYDKSKRPEKEDFYSDKFIECLEDYSNVHKKNAETLETEYKTIKECIKKLHIPVLKHLTSYNIKKYKEEKKQKLDIEIERQKIIDKWINSIKNKESKLTVILAKHPYK